MEEANQILSLFKTDREKAFDLLYNTYYEVLYLYANQLVNDPSAAKDIVQDVFISFWIQKRYQKPRLTLPNYLYQSVRFTSLNFVRNRNRRQEIQGDILKESVPEEAINIPIQQQADEYAILYEAINRLPEDRKRIFLMVFVDELKYQEVADQLNISINTVKTQLQRSLKQLRDTLEDHYLPSILLLFFKKNIFPVTRFE